MQEHIYRPNGKKSGKKIIDATDSDIQKFLEKVVAFFSKGFTGVFKKLPRCISAVVAIIAISICCICGFSFSKTVSAVQITFDNEAIGFVKDNSVVAEAQVLAVKIVSNSDCNSFLAVPKTSSGVASAGQLIDAEKLSEIIVSRSLSIVNKTFLYIDNEKVAKSTSVENTNNLLDNYLNSFKLSSSSDSVAVSPRVSVINEYSVDYEANKLPDVEEYLSNPQNIIPVEQFYTVIESRTIPFTETVVKTDKLYVGSEKATVVGVNGSEEVTFKVFTADDGRTTKTEVSSKIVKKPIDSIKYIGTKKVFSTDKNGTAVMTWPVKRVAGSYVSSYMGDGRGHQGMDIAAPAGTNIYAAYKGTVIYSGFSSGYGNHIIIEHSNGYKTVYAHCSTLYVTKGTTVGEGEKIASVGCTGEATGNHLHFEVRKGETKVNPVPYIGYN